MWGDGFTSPDRTARCPALQAGLQRCSCTLGWPPASTSATMRDRVKVPTIARRLKSISSPDGGTNHIPGRTLLCGPCNRLKTNAVTLSGLRRENKKRGYLANL